MVYRTKTYIAGDWDHDRDAVVQLYKWKNGNKWNFDFLYAYDISTRYKLTSLASRCISISINKSTNHNTGSGDRTIQSV